MNDGNGGDGRALGFFGESAFMGLAANQSHRSGHHQDEQRNANDQQGFPRGSGRKFRGRRQGLRLMTRPLFHGRDFFIDLRSCHVLGAFSVVRTVAAFGPALPFSHCHLPRFILSAHP